MTLRVLMWVLVLIGYWVTQASVAVIASEYTNDIESRWISAISNDNTEVLSEIYKHHNLAHLTASNGKTALMVACKVGDADFAKQLVAAGADIKAKTVTDGTAFMFAVLGDQQHLADWLQGLGADINARGSNGWTSVMIASAKGLDKTLDWLLQEGANGQTPDVYGFSPLMRAVDNQHEASVKLLLANEKVDVTWQDEIDNTALHYAVSGENVRIVNQLLSVGASPLMKNRDGVSVLALAKQLSEDSTNSEQLRALRISIQKALMNAL